MAQQLGRLLLIKLGDGGDPETFSNLCGFRSQNFSMSANRVDTTTPNCDSPGDVVQMTSRPGIQDLSFSGSGIFKDNAVMTSTVDAARLGTTNNYQIVVPGYGTFEGPFAITDFEFSGEMEGDMEFSATFVPTAAATFTAE